jgi:uncharacterized membrane protein
MTVYGVSHSESTDSVTHVRGPLPVSWVGVTTGVARHWLGLFNLAWGIFFGLPWLAPLLMKVGATWPARALYFVYGFLCHQFADRSFFLFGQQFSYPASELLPLAPQGAPHLALRAFLGTPELGYKVAWSDRMIALYGGILVGGLLFALVRRWLRRPNLLWPALLLFPMAIDGTTHVVSDFAPFDVGFRYTNAWLATLTQHRLGQAFYLGNALGSFNSWARLISGTLAGLAVAWAAFPTVEACVSRARSARREQVTTAHQRQEPAQPLPSDIRWEG